jgi:hypothetical protein
MSNPRLNEFMHFNSDLVKNCFLSYSTIDDRRSTIVRIRSLDFKIRKYIFELFCTLFLLAKEPGVFFAQIAMRRGGGLSGSYQFHRLYEIRRILKNNDVSSAIEFGSGASSLLFNKYVDRFVTVEESNSWAKHYLLMLNGIRFLPGIRANMEKLKIQVLTRLEFIDSTGELVSSYEIPPEIIEEKFDLAYIDGPTSWIQTDINENVSIRDRERLIPNITVLELSTLPRMILIDGRRATVSYLIEKGGFGEVQIGLRGLYRKKPRIRPYHTSIYK